MIERCRNGHPRTKTNTYTAPDGAIECRICRSHASRRKYRKRVEGALFLLGLHMGTSLWLLALMHFHGTGLHFLIGFLFGD